VYIYIYTIICKHKAWGEKGVLKMEKFRTSDVCKYFLQISMLSEVSRQDVGTKKTPVPWAAGGGVLPPRIRRRGREGDHASPPSTKMKNNLTYTSTPPYSFIQNF
jgi:hypothetical protein